MPGSTWEGSEGVLDASWTSLGRLLAALGRLLDPLGRFLATSWALSGATWLISDAFGYILTHQDAPGLDFGGFGSMPGWVLEGLAGMFWHALRCASHFIT